MSSTMSVEEQVAAAWLAMCELTVPCENLDCDPGGKSYQTRCKDCGGSGRRPLLPIKKLRQDCPCVDVTTDESPCSACWTGHPNECSRCGGRGWLSKPDAWALMTWAYENADCRAFIFLPNPSIKGEIVCFIESAHGRTLGNASAIHHYDALVLSLSSVLVSAYRT